MTLLSYMFDDTISDTAVLHVFDDTISDTAVLHVFAALAG